MRLNAMKLGLALTVLTVLVMGAAGQGETIPKAWDDNENARAELPVVSLNGPRTYVPAGYYYKIPERVIYKSYPVYAAGKEPAGYLEWLKQQEPQVIFDPAALKSAADWIKAGEAVYAAPTFPVAIEELRSSEWLKGTEMPVAADGTIPFYRYVVTKKGEVVARQAGCAFCHTRVMPDGAVLNGVQGNLPFGKLVAHGLRTRAQAITNEEAMKKSIEQRNQSFLLSYYTPWVASDPNRALERLSIPELIAGYEAIPPGVMFRFHTSLLYPAKIPDLIGLKERRYFDSTGIVLHRSITDLMRYAAVLGAAENFMFKYGDFVPGGRPPEPERLQRFSDAQLYALARYLYALPPPPNKHRFDRWARRGQRVFQREQCARCHTPPLYTNNRLVPAADFQPPAEHVKLYDIMAEDTGGDAGLALHTRKGTGYYKVPTLKGVWHRGPFEHNGSVMTLEDWFDGGRLREDYLPTGFRGFGRQRRAVKGHPYGLNLSPADKRALIAFLKTL